MYLEILKEAKEKGIIALKNCVPTPMRFISVDINDKPLVEGDEGEIEYDGECGGAYITGINGKSDFVSWCKRNASSMENYARLNKGTYKGYDLLLNHGDYNGQSVERFTAFAEAFCKVLNDAGIKCGVKSYLS